MLLQVTREDALTQIDMEDELIDEGILDCMVNEGNTINEARSSKPEL